MRNDHLFWGLYTLVRLLLVLRVKHGCSFVIRCTYKAKHLVFRNMNGFCWIQKTRSFWGPINWECKNYISLSPHTHTHTHHIHALSQIATKTPTHVQTTAPPNATTHALVKILTLNWRSNKKFSNKSESYLDNWNFLSRQSPLQGFCEIEVVFEYDVSWTGTWQYVGRG